MTFNAVDLYPYHAADGPMYAETVVKCSPFYIMTIRASIHGQSSNIEVRRMSNPQRTINNNYSNYQVFTNLTLLKQSHQLI